MTTDSERVEVLIDGTVLHVAANTSVAAAVLNHGGSASLPSRRSGWTPLCGMGVCWGCRLTIDGQANRRSCLIPVAAGMRIDTQPNGSEPEAP